MKVNYGLMLDFLLCYIRNKHDDDILVLITSASRQYSDHLVHAHISPAPLLLAYMMLNAVDGASDVYVPVSHELTCTLYSLHAG